MYYISYRTCVIVVYICIYIYIQRAEKGQHATGPTLTIYKHQCIFYILHPKLFFTFYWRKVVIYNGNSLLYFWCPFCAPGHPMPQMNQNSHSMSYAWYKLHLLLCAGSLFCCSVFILCWHVLCSLVGIRLLHTVQLWGQDWIHKWFMSIVSELERGWLSATHLNQDTRFRCAAREQKFTLQARPSRWHAQIKERIWSHHSIRLGNRGTYDMCVFGCLVHANMNDMRPTTIYGLLFLSSFSVT